MSKSIQQVQQELATLMSEMKKSDFVGILEENDKGYYDEAYNALQTAHIYLGLADADEKLQNQSSEVK